MMASEQCYISDCSSVPGYYCNCGVIICEDHLSIHIKQNNRHTLHNLWVDLDAIEIDNIRNCSEVLDQSLNSRCIQIDLELQRKEQSLHSRLENARDFCHRSKENMSMRKLQIENLLNSLILNRSMSKTGSMSLEKALFNYKNSHKLIINQSWLTQIFESFLESGAFSLTNYTINFKDGLFFAYNSNFEETRITLDAQLYFTVSNCLNLADGSILLVNIKDSYMIWPQRAEYKKLPPLNTARYYTSLGFVKNEPCVIGGFISQNIASVELFNEEWTEIEILNIPRHCAAVCCLNGFTYVLGGYDGGGYNNVTDTIEIYEYDHWTLAEFKLPIPMANVGVYPLMNQILVLGGSANCQNFNTVYLWNGEKEWIECPSLNQSTKFSVNAWIYVDHTLINFDDSAQKISYNLESIF